MVLLRWRRYFPARTLRMSPIKRAFLSAAGAKLSSSFHSESATSKRRTQS